jgi:hypothetical protein
MHLAKKPLFMKQKHPHFYTSVYLSIFLIILSSAALFAQNAGNYAFTTDSSSSLTKDRNGTPIDMSTGTTFLIGSGNDAFNSPVTSIGFTYYLMGKPFTQFALQEDGLIQLGGGTPTTNTYTITGGTANAPRLSAFCADLRTGTINGEIRCKLFGASPNRVLVIEFKEMQLFYATAASGTSTFQTRLYENGMLEFVYGTMSVTNINSSNRNPSIGFYTGANPGLFASISYATHTMATTGLYSANALVPNLGPLQQLTSTTDSTRRAYLFTPKPIPSAPTNLSFSNITASSITLNWTDNDSNEAAYQLFRSIDGITYSLISTLASNTVNFIATDLIPGNTYYWNVIAIGEGGASDTLRGSQSTMNAALVKSTNTGGNWNNPLTWIGGVVPEMSDSVVIADSAVVTINSLSATCHSLTVGEGISGLLQFDFSQASSLTVATNVYVQTNAIFYAGSGSLTTHNLKIGGATATAFGDGSLKVNGVFDMQTTAGVSVSFLGIGNAKIEGTPTTLDFRSIIVNKGATSTNRPVLEILTPFTVQGGNTLGLISTHTAGVVRIGGTFTQSNPIYTTANYTIPLNGGVHLNNPNFTVTPLASAATCNGLLQVSQGVFNIGQTATHTFTFGTNAQFTVDGGSVIAAAGIQSTLAFTFNFSSGNINVARIGNSISNSASFGITNIGAVINWTGGKLTLEKKSTGATQIDYYILPSIAANAGGTLQIGTSVTTANTLFNIRGYAPNLLIDSSKSATLIGQITVLGSIVVNPGSVLKLNSYNLLQVGGMVNNNGFIDGRVANSHWTFSQSTIGHVYQGTGVDTLQKITAIDTNTIVLNKQIVAYNLNFNGQSPITHSNNIILGNGLTQSVLVQIGVAGYSNGNVGTFDTFPTFNLGTGTYTVYYLQEGAMRNTGYEIPPTRTVSTLTINNTNNVTLLGGPLNIKIVFGLIAGRFITSTTNLLKLFDPTTSSISGGSATSYVDGPLQRTLPASLTISSPFVFPIGKGTSYNRMDLVNTRTNSGGNVDVLVESFNTTPGGSADHITIDSLMPKYWSITLPNGKTNIDSTYLKFYNADLSLLNKMAYSDSVLGVFKRVSNTASNGSIITNAVIGDTAIEGIFAIGEVTNPIAGSFLIGANKVAPNYTSLTEAMADIAERRVQGTVQLLLDADYSSSLETFPISFNPFVASSSTHTITIKPNIGVSTSIIGASATSILRFTNGAKNYVFDGSNNGTQSQHVFIQNTNPGASIAVAVVMFQGTADNEGVQNCILKNTIIKSRLGNNALAYGILVGGTTINHTAGGMGHKDLLIQNNTIYNCDYAIVLNGTSASNKISKINLSRNIIGSDSSSLSNRRYGIYTRYADSIIIESNTIKNIVSPYDDARTGIGLNDYTTNSLIYGNVINGLYTNKSNDFADGILIPNNNGVDNIRIINNVIRNIGSSAIASTALIFKTAGIRLWGGNNLKLYFNTIHLSGLLNTGTGTNSSAALYLQNANLIGLDIRNNIFSNSMTGLSTSSKHYAFAAISPVTSSLFDYNNFITNSAQGVLMYQNTPALYINTMAELRTATNANTNSININPEFINDTNLVIGLGPLKGLGQPITGITMDIDDSVRTNPPTMGAYERQKDIIPAFISYTPLTKHAALVSRVLSNFATITDYSGVDTAANRPRIYFRKNTDANLFGTYPANNNASFNGWKYVEAYDSISPFSFTIDYSLLTSGGVSVWDTIEYFVTAQDIDANVSANPSIGFSAITINSIISAPITPNRYVVYDAPLAGSYLVGATYSYPNFSSITSAVNALHARGVNGPVTLRLADSLYSPLFETFPITINEIEGASLTNTITLKTDSARKVSIIGTSTSGLLNFNGTDFFTVDGSNNNTTSQDLFIQNTNPSGVGIMFQGTTLNQGSQNCALKNTVIKGGSNTSAIGILLGGTNVGLTPVGIGHKNLLIQNNTLYNCSDAVVVVGSFGSRLNGIKISGNIIGTDSALFYNKRYGLYLHYADSFIVEHNTIKNLKTNISNISNAGIYLYEFVTNGIVNGNTIAGIHSLSSTGTAIGLYFAGLNGMNNIRASNNSISNILTTNNTSSLTTLSPQGIRISGGQNIKLYFNTVHLAGSPTVGTAKNYSVALLLTQSGVMTGLDIRNNIFSNNMSSINPTSKHYTFATLSAFSGAQFDYNNFVTNSPQGFLMYQNSPVFEINTLPELKTITAANNNSVSVDPQFINDSNLVIGYGALTGLGTPIAEITKDIDDSLRSNPPTLGAYERKTDLVGPAIFYSPLAKYYLDSVRVLTNFANITDYTGVDTTTAKPRIYFRKSTETNAFGIYPANNNAAFNGWKYVEASNNTSPFSFSIDYRLLTSGSISLWDTIVYFVVAQDVDSKTTANPSVGFVASKIDSITSAPLTPYKYVIYDTPLAGTYLVGSANTSPNFSTITAATAALQIRGISAPVELLLTDSSYSNSTEAFPIIFSPSEGSSRTNTITLKPAIGKKVAIIGSSSTGLINANGIDNFIIDGSNNNTTSADLFIQNTTADGVGIMFQGTTSNQGVENSTFKNTIIKGGTNTSSYGIIIGGEAVGLSSNGIGHKDLVIQNNTIYNCRDAVVISGGNLVADKVRGVTIQNNIIGTDSGSFYNTRAGIYLIYVDSITLHKNIIKNIKTNSSINTAGITVYSFTTNSKITANIIHGVNATNASGRMAYGINIETGAGCDNINIINNAISDIKGTQSTSNFSNAFGIRINGGSNIRLYHNTVHLYGPSVTTNLNSSTALGIYNTSLAGLDIRNNIFSNNMTSSNANSKFFALTCYTPFPVSIFDNNDFISNSPQGVLMYSTTTSLTNPIYTTTIDGLKTITNANAHSVTINPLFVNDSTLVPSFGTVQGMGVALPEVSYDIFDSIRSATPTIGAYEKGVDSKSPVITYTALENTTQLTNRVLSAEITDYSGVDTTTAKPRVYYRKTTNANVFGNYPTDNNASFNGWKYVEASNTTSPFIFTIDYSLLTSSGISIWETIEYFVAAQDLASPTNISANPDTGLIATNVNTITKAPNTPNRYLIKDLPLTGIYNVGAAYTYPHFTTLADAVDALNNRGVSAPVILQLTDANYSTAGVSINEVVGSSVINTVTIKPALGNNATITGYSNDGLISVRGADYITIDGSNNGTKSQDLLIQNIYPYQGASLIVFQATANNQGVQHAMLKNTVINGGSRYYNTTGINIEGASSTSSFDKVLTIQNNSIHNCTKAIVLKGVSSTNKVRSVMLLDNMIGGDTVTLYNGNFGVYLNNCDSITLRHNIIHNMLASGSSTSSAIHLAEYTTNCIIDANTIKGVYSRNGYLDGAFGINIGSSIGVNNITIINNAISEITVTSTSVFSSITSNTAIGIRVLGGSNIKLYFNTVHLSRSLLSEDVFSSSALLIASNSIDGLDIRNNIFSNNTVGVYANSKQYSLICYTPFQTSIFDNNNFTANSSQGVLMRGYNGSTVTDYSTLASLKTATNANTSSVSINPFFAADSNLVPNFGTVEGLGVSIPGLTLDIVDSVRSSIPTLGAYENGFDGLSPTITYSLLENNSQRLNRVLSGFATITDYSGINTTTAKPRLYFKKAADTSAFGNYPTNNNSAFNGWKFVEATNTISPFNFTIDYSLLAGGSVNLWDTIQYFVVAQDNVDTTHISANPSKGFEATTINLLTNAPDTVNSYIVVDNPLAGNYHVGSNQVYPNFSSIKAAVKALNLSGVSAPVTLQLTDSLYSPATEIFPITINEIIGSSPLNIITLKPASGKKVAIIGASATGIINLNGTDNFIVDGSNNGTQSKDLFIQQTGSSNGAVFMFQGLDSAHGSQNCVLKNTKLKGGNNAYYYNNFGLIIGGQTASLSGGGGNNNILIQNNDIYNCAFGIVLSGVVNSKAANISLLNNTVGTDTANIGIGQIGIYTNYVDSITAFRNTIKNVRGNHINNVGIQIEGNTSNGLFSKNTITGLQGYPDYYDYNDDYGTFGIKVGGNNNNNLTFSNNVLSDIVNVEYWSNIGMQLRVFGIKIGSGSNIKLHFNSVHLNGSLVRGSSVALYIDPTTTTGLDIRNNIFSNGLTRAYNEQGVNYALCLKSVGQIPSSIFDYNDFIAPGNYGVLMSIKNGSSINPISTLSDLKIATLANTSSVNIDPLFASSTNLRIGLNTLMGLGTPISGIMDDIVDSLRSNPPTIGAFENGADITGPEIAYSTLSNPKTLANRVLTDFATITDYSGINTTTSKPRLYYRKSTNANGFGNSPSTNNSSFNGWKYAEAMDTLSPFDFTIDYSRLFGGVSELDTIMYFVVAEDKSVNLNISGYPNSGFSAIRIDSIMSAPSIPSSYIIDYIPLAGNYFVGAGQTAPNYTTITAAVNALHLRGISAPVVFQLTNATYTTPAETFPITINEIVGTTDSNTITFKPAVGNRLTITGSIAGAGLFNINGTDHLIIDGSNNGTSSQDIYIRNTNTSGYGIWFQGDLYNQGAQSSTLKNTIIKGGGNSNSYGIIIGGTTSVYSWGGSILGGIGKGGVGHENLLIQNNTIYNCVDALVISGQSDAIPVVGVKIVGNTIGTDTTSSPNTRNGIYMQFNLSTIIDKNIIKNVKNVSSVNNAAGINVKDYTHSCVISNNIIRGIYATNIIGMGAYGINLDAPGLFMLVINNNAISDIITSNYSASPFTSRNAYGIRVAGVSELRMFFNTVHLYGQPTIGSNLSSSAALFIENASGVDIRNNIFSNSMTGKISGSKHYAFSLLNLPFSYSFDYNDFIAISSHGVLMADSLTASDVTTLADLKIATSSNVNSVSIDPQFASNTNLTLGTSTLQGLGTPILDTLWLYPTYIASFQRDILDSIRNTPPTIGAYESSPVTVPVKLISFNASVEEQNVVLHWKTASEINNRGFEIERSTDGRSFEKIGFVKGADKSNALRKYNLTDANALATESVLYYRLKQLDFDGKYEYSAIVKVSREHRNATGLEVFPNPYSTQSSLSFTSTLFGRATIELMDLKGEVLSRQIAEVSRGGNTIDIRDAHMMQAGVYIVKLTLNNETHFVKLVKN